MFFHYNNLKEHSTVITFRLTHNVSMSSKKNQDAKLVFAFDYELT